jgi:hypothetical protein
MLKNEKYKGKLTATSTGYYKGAIIEEGQSFNFDGILVNGKFPLWVKIPEGHKAKISEKAKLKDLDVPEESDDII